MMATSTMMMAAQTSVTLKLDGTAHPLLMDPPRPARLIVAMEFWCPVKRPVTMATTRMEMDVTPHVLLRLAGTAAMTSWPRAAVRQGVTMGYWCWLMSSVMTMDWTQEMAVT